MQAANAHFGFRADPFAITPDPRFLYLSPLHKEGLAHLLYGMREGGGFVQLTGEVGTGKTTLYRSVLEQIPDNVEVALILNPRQTAPELLASVCDELHIPYRREQLSLKELVDHLTAYLLDAHAAGRRVVLIIDEAQDLTRDVLEQVRLLTNLETAERKLLLVVLVGQPELRDMLDRADLRQLAQRVTARYHLMPLSLEETAEYIEHRQRLAEGTGGVFNRAAMRAVYRLSGGIPRLINVICERALIAAYADQLPSVDGSTVRRAGREVMRGNKASRPARRVAWAWLSAVAALLAGAAALLYTQGHLPPFALPALVRPVVESTAPVDRAVPRASPSPEESLLTRLRDGKLPGDTAGAMRNLFALWGREYADIPGAVACDRARAAGLECATGTDGFAGLERLNRAAAIEVQDDQGARHHLVLAGLDREGAELIVGDRRVRVSREELAKLWSGVYLVLSRQRPDIRMLKQGDRGDAVLWLRRSLADGGEGAGNASPVFDARLADAVRRFQASRGLDADGVVGEQTILALLAVDGERHEPLLRVREP